MNFKKIPSKKYFFFLVENHFQKKVEKNPDFFFDFQNSQKINFFEKIKNIDFFEKVDFLEILKIEKFSGFFFQVFFENVFRPEKKIDGIFFKVHLLVQEKRFEAVSERSRQFKTRKSHAEKMSTK